MFNTNCLQVKRGLINLTYCLLLTIILNTCSSQQQDIPLTPLKSDPLTIDLYHKFNSNQDFKLRGSILVKPRTEYRAASATILNQLQLSESDVLDLKKASEVNDNYYLKASWRKGKGDKAAILKSTQTLVKSCSIYVSNLADFVTVNLSPHNDFISVNLFTTDPECKGTSPSKLSRDFNTTVQVGTTQLGPVPDTATYIKRLEEERSNKAREGKQDDRSFFAKYWIYIVPAVIILMIFSGPEQGAR